MKYVLHEISWITLRMMIADAPKYNKSSDKERAVELPDDLDELNRMLKL